MKTSHFAFIFILVLAITSTANSQDTSEKPYKNAVTLNVTRIILLEPRFGYELNLTERKIIRATVGYKIPTSSSFYNNWNSWFTFPLYYKVTKGPYFSLAYTHVLNPKTHLYLSPELYYDYHFFDRKYYKFCAGTSHDSFISLRSRHLTKTGIKVLIGKKGSLLPGKKTRLQFDFYGGIGLQYWHEDLTVHAERMGTCSAGQLVEEAYFDPPKEEKKNALTLSFHAGILLSYPF